MIKNDFVSFFPGYLKLLPTNIQPTVTYFLDKSIFNSTTEIIKLKSANPIIYAKGINFFKSLFIIKTKADLFNLIILAYIGLYLGVVVYNNYCTLRKRFFVPKIFFEYSNLIRKKNQIIKEIYELCVELKKENEIFAFIPEISLLKKVINSKNCKEIEDDFYFGYYDRFITSIKSYKILEFSNKLSEKYNF